MLKCRPPGNRDPLPVEIENCREYLLAQIELIQPRVICTLGNFATKLLRDDPTGITRLHGQPEMRTIGDRAVRLYPLLPPGGGALHAGRTLETLRDGLRAACRTLLALPAPAQPERLEEPAPSSSAEDDPARGRAGARATGAGRGCPPATSSTCSEPGRLGAPAGGAGQAVARA